MNIKSVCNSDNLNLIFDIQFSQIKVISKKEFDLKLNYRYIRIQYQRVLSSQKIELALLTRTAEFYGP